MDRTQISFETQRLGIRSCKLSDADTLSSSMTAQISQWVAHWSFSLSPQQAQANIASYLETASASLGFPAVICKKTDRPDYRLAHAAIATGPKE